MNGDVSLKSLKFILLFTAIAALTVYAVAGSLADDGADEKYLTIVQSDLRKSLKAENCTALCKENPKKNR